MRIQIGIYEKIWSKPSEVPSRSVPGNYLEPYYIEYPLSPDSRLHTDKVSKSSANLLTLRVILLGNLCSPPGPRAARVTYVLVMGRGSGRTVLLFSTRSHPPPVPPKYHFRSPLTPLRNIHCPSPSPHTGPWQTSSWTISGSTRTNLSKDLSPLSPLPPPPRPPSQLGLQSRVLPAPWLQPYWPVRLID